MQPEMSSHTIFIIEDIENLSLLNNYNYSYHHVFLLVIFTHTIKISTFKVVGRKISTDWYYYKPVYLRLPPSKQVLNLS